MNELLKSHFLRLYSMVIADGIVEAKELEALYRIGRENYNLPAEEINRVIVESGTSFVAPENVEDRISILFQMAEIAWADGEVDKTERHLLTRYAIRLGFQSDNAEEIADYMLEQVKSGKKEKEVINEITNK
ncbi:MAG: TerB family tellurite resistance protein [Bacteroidales bacterium]|nr:TerB family tellurite resistance protein [Bacteroidales bacterium]MCM1148280.1 TerB family tellurite resistance protein [Bacteroidales bacterium]MCM1206603.1 TerB family tellurite resistance protein [Bacillota bacterium]MCM1510495.1 TerB family tellurite resistance protein [Clostridium sp.]